MAFGCPGRHDVEVRQLGPDHLNVAMSRGNLVAVLYSLQDYPKALAEIDLALDLFRRKLPAGHPHIGIAERWRARILEKLGR